MALGGRQGWWSKVKCQAQGLRVVVRTYPSTLLWPVLLFALLCGIGVWAVSRGAQAAADNAKVRAQSLAKDAAVEYRQLLAVSFSLTQVLASLIQHNPQYDAVVRIFNATAPALASAAPQTCVQTLQLAPAAVIRAVYPMNEANSFLLERDLFGDPAVAPLVRYAISNPNISLEGPLPPSSLAKGTLLVVRKAIHVPVTDPGDTFGRPDEPNLLCGAPCEYNATTGTKFWGTVAVRIELDSLRVPMGDVMVSAPLRTLVALGYRYSLTAPPRARVNSGSSTGGDAGGSRQMVVEESRSHPSSKDAVSATVDLAPDVQWTLLVGPSSHGWMPSWYSGVVAAVAVLSLAASLLLFGLLVSRRRHQMLLRSLLPPDLIRDLQNENDQTPLEPKVFTSETPADVLMGLLSALLSGMPPDLRDVVLLKTVLRRRLDVYRPLNLGGRLRDANLDADVAHALMRQLGDSPDMTGTGTSAPWVVEHVNAVQVGQTTGQYSPYSKAQRQHISGSGTCGGKGAAICGGDSRSHMLAAPAVGGGMGMRSGSSLTSLQQREQQLMLECSSVTGALAYILSMGPMDLGPVAMEVDCCAAPTSSKSALAAATRRQDLVITATDLVPDGPTLVSLAPVSNRSIHSSPNISMGGPQTVMADAGSNQLAEAPIEAAAVSLSPVLSSRVSSTPTASPPLQLQHSHSLQRSRLGSGSGLYLRIMGPLGGKGTDAGRRGNSPLSNARSAHAGSDTTMTVGSEAATAAISTVASGGDGASAACCTGSFGGTLLASSTSAVAMVPPVAARRCGEAVRMPASSCCDTPPDEPQGSGQQRQWQQEDLGQPTGPAGLQPAAGPHLHCLQGPGSFGATLKGSNKQLQQACASTPSSPAGRMRERLAYGLTASPKNAVMMSHSRRRSSMGPGERGGMGLTHFLSQTQRNNAPDVGQNDGGDGHSGALASAPPLALLMSSTAVEPGTGLGTKVGTADCSDDGAGSVQGGEGGDEAGRQATRAACAAVEEAAETVRQAEPTMLLSAPRGHLDSSQLATARLMPSPTPPRPLVEEVEKLLARCDSWQFDTWGLQEASGGHALSALGFFLLQRERLVGRFGLEPLKLARLLRTLESGYPTSNPYHNSAHAADVLHTLHVLLHGARLTSHYLDHLGLLAAYFAAIVHDYGHPGLTNDFLVATSHPLALRYNDRAPLESHHAAAAFTLLAERPDLDITAGLSKQDRAAFRKQVIELVLATDMKQHFAILNQFNTAHRLAANRTGTGSSGARPTPPSSLHQSPQQQQATSSTGSGGVAGGGPSCATALERPSKTKPTDPISGATGGGGGGGGPGSSRPSTDVNKPSPGGSGGPAGGCGGGGRALQQGATVAVNAACAAAGVVPPVPLDEAERLLSLQVMLKAADIGHLGADLERHKRWLSVLEEEFFRQGDQERQLGLPISPLFDRVKQGVSKSQVGFYDFVALPLIRAVATAFPGAGPLLHFFQDNYHHWRRVEAETAATAAAAAAAAMAPATPSDAAETAPAATAAAVAATQEEPATATGTTVGSPITPEPATLHGATRGGGDDNEGRR